MVRDGKFYRTMFKIAIPSALQSLVNFLVVIADDIMVSKMADGVTAQAAVSQINGITAFYTATLLGLVSGASVLTAQYWGRKDIRRIKQLFSLVMWISIGAAAVFVAAACIFPNAIVSLVISKEETAVTETALSYFAIVCFSWIPYAVTQALQGMLRTIEIVRVTLYISIASLCMNIGLNYVLIFGKLGMPAMGVEGAAIATLITRLAELAIVWIFTFHKQKQFPLKPKDLLRTEGRLARDYVKYGLPVGFTDMQWSLIGMLKAAIIGQMGKAFMAANSITSSMMNLGTMFTFALAEGACVVVGKAVGAEEYDKAREYSNTIQILFAGIGIMMAAVVYGLAKPFTGLYGSASDAEVAKLTVTMIRIGAWTLLGTSYHAACFIGINRGAGDSRFVAKVDMLCGWLVVMPLTILSAFVWKMSLPMVFLMTRIDQCFKWIIAFFRLRGNKWIQNVTRKAAE